MDILIFLLYNNVIYGTFIRMLLFLLNWCDAVIICFVNKVDVDVEFHNFSLVHIFIEVISQYQAGSIVLPGSWLMFFSA